MRSLQDRFLLLLQEFPHITKADLARTAGVKQPSVSDWFSGKTKTLKAGPASKIAKKYGISAHWLATGNGSMRDSTHIDTQSAASSPPSAPSLEQTLDAFVLALSSSPEQERERLMLSLAALAQNPSDTVERAYLLAKLGAGNPASATQPPPPHFLPTSQR